jgi:UDP-N-acetylmuramoyl-L-alanyl-D-glutamate--2,6-diaminopimelate ligase
MKIKEFVHSLEGSISQQNIGKLSEDFNVSHLTEYLQDVEEGYAVFVTLPEDQSASTEILERYLPKEIDPKTFVIVSNNPPPSEYSYICCHLESSKKVLNDLIYPLPKDYNFVGVTGTNGKTSVVNMAVSMLAKQNKPALGLGTVGVRLGNKMLVSGSRNSTFPYTEVRRIAYENLATTNTMIMELTSHALKQKRLIDIKFNHLMWTNFTQDHLDYHQTEEDYFQSKLKITELSDVLYLPEDQAGLFKRIQESRPEYQVKKVEFKDRFSNSVPDGFIKQNLSMAVKLAELVLEKDIDVKLGEYQEFLPEGRFQIIQRDQKICIVDYAHTPDALEKLLKEVQINFPGRERIIVFGCGGDRDRSKRPLMTKAAQMNSELVIITSDNPRNEAPSQIIEDAIEGIDKSKKYLSFINREDAIKEAINIATDQNVIIIAGKGHEDYQDIKGVKHPFKDVEVVRKYL